jgi:hypothetical protein
MTTEQLNLKSGKWLVADCGSMSSESNCQLVMLAPEDQKEDLIEAGVKHAVHKHGHQDNEEVRAGVSAMLQVTEIN